MTATTPQPEQAPAPAPVSFREFRGLVRFELGSGKVVWTVMRKEGGPPPIVALRWFDGRHWRRDFGGEWHTLPTRRQYWVWK